MSPVFPRERPSVESLLADFRELVADGIKRAERLGRKARVYEGETVLTISTPSPFERERSTVYTLFVRCYVYGPGGNQNWTGTDAAALFKRATDDVLRWQDQPGGA